MFAVSSKSTTNKLNFVSCLIDM